jgi:hypothetical protein
MATLTITASGLAARSKIISASDVTRFLDAYRSVYGQGLSNQEVFDAFADGVFGGIIAFIRSTEENTVVTAAKAGVADISLT